MLKESNFVKIRVTVPVEAAPAVREALGNAGAGKQGKYEFCSASFPVAGRFRPLPGANPAIGEMGELEEVQEEMIETICHKDLIKQVVEAVKKVHPYEEP